jgi:hypothetical protein
VVCLAIWYFQHPEGTIVLSSTLTNGGYESWKVQPSGHFTITLSSGCQNSLAFRRILSAPAKNLSSRSHRNDSRF